MTTTSSKDSLTYSTTTTSTGTPFTELNDTTSTSFNETWKDVPSPRAQMEFALYSKITGKPPLYPEKSKQKVKKLVRGKAVKIERDDEDDWGNYIDLDVGRGRKRRKTRKGRNSSHKKSKTPKTRRRKH